MNRTAVVIAVLACISVVPAGVTAVEKDTPLADAGLDQRAEVGETVLLDGTGSRDPGGTIETYEWQIETPDGTRLTPADPADPRTRFVVREPGRYDVTVTVTDGDGARSSDTLYVYVTEGVSFSSNSGNSIAVSQSPQPGKSQSVSPDPWYSSWDTLGPDNNPYLGPGIMDGIQREDPSDPGNITWPYEGPNDPIDIPTSPQEKDTLLIEASDLTYKEDVAYRYFGERRLEGKQMGDGEGPINEVVEGVEGVHAGLSQAIFGTEEETISYQVSGKTARDMQDMADYSSGVHEDEIAEKMNIRSNAPAVKEDYVANDAKVVDPVSDSADTVEVKVHITENMGATDYAAMAVGAGVYKAGDATESVASTITKSIPQVTKDSGR